LFIRRSREPNTHTQQSERNNQNRNAVIFFFLHPFLVFKRHDEQKGATGRWGSNCEIKSSKRAPVYF
jgi:hypothetical protein